jgi:glycosyltransferase involved in cell wall biosynthesis
MLLSAAIIVRDEAEHLDACLASLDGLVDEIVVVDTGSSDGSVEVARRHGAVVGHEPWQDDFSGPRNRSLDLASGEWILYIDADERVRPGAHAAVRAHLRAASDHVAFRVRFVPRVHWTPYREYRLWRHRPDIRFTGAIHESMLRAISGVARRDGLLISNLDAVVPDGLTIEHLGYEGDQSHKHLRNEPMLREALAVSPDRPFLYDHLARIYEDRGELDRARATWRAGIDVARQRATEHPDDRLLWINLLVHAVAREDPDGDVAALIDEAHERFPGNPAVEFATATHELATGDPASAARRLEALIALDLDTIVESGSAYDERIFGEWAWNALGLCRFELGDDTGAAAAFRRAAAADPENDSYRTRRRLAEARAAAEHAGS